MLVGVVCLAPVTAAAQTPAPAPVVSAWAPTDIGVLGGATYSGANGLNDQGTVVGAYEAEGGSTYRAFVWTGGSGWSIPERSGALTPPRQA